MSFLKTRIAFLVMLFEFNTFFPKQCFRPIHRAERREKRLIGNVVRLLAPVAGTIASVPIESAAAYVGQVKTSRVSDFVADRLGLLEAFFCLVPSLVRAVKIAMFGASENVLDDSDRQNTKPLVLLSPLVLHRPGSGNLGPKHQTQSRFVNVHPPSGRLTCSLAAGGGVTTGATFWRLCAV